MSTQPVIVTPLPAPDLSMQTLDDLIKKLAKPAPSNDQPPAADPYGADHVRTPRVVDLSA